MTQPATGAGATASRRNSSPVLALDLGGTQLRAAVVMADGRLLGRTVARTPRDGSAQDVVDACLGVLARAAAAAPADLAPAALGISAPGPLDPATGRLLDPPNLHRSLWNFGLAEALAAGIGLPAVLDKDTNVAALAEGHFGAGRGVADFVYLTVSTGVGGAVVSGGQLVSGADGAAGELGHLMVDPAGPACGCGVRGHLEAYSSGTGIAARLRQALASGAVHPATPLALLAAERDASGLEARDVAAAEDAGDPVAAEIMEGARDAFAAAMVAIVNVFNPARVVVGGGISLGQGERLLEPARRRVRASAFRVQAARVQIVPAELGDDVGLVGALPLVARPDPAHLGGPVAGRLALPPAPAPGDDPIRRVEDPQHSTTRSLEELTT